jgi:DNA-binding CsgD family transcriptional regulator
MRPDEALASAQRAIGAAAQAAARWRRQPVPRGSKPMARANLAGLTDRQVEILRLVVAGRTNAEIAAELVLSVRAVDHQVSAVLQRLGITSRREVPRAAVRHGLRCRPVASAPVATWVVPRLVWAAATVAPCRCRARSSSGSIHPGRKEHRP